MNHKSQTLKESDNSLKKIPLGCLQASLSTGVFLPDSSDNIDSFFPCKDSLMVRVTFNPSADSLVCMHVEKNYRGLDFE